MSSITPAAFEILVTRELRRAGVEPSGLRRHELRTTETAFQFDLIGRLEAYRHKWTVLIGCSNQLSAIGPTDIRELRRRADEARTASALLFTTAQFEPAALATARELYTPLLQVVDARAALLQAGLIQSGPLPAWVPEFTVLLVTATRPPQLLQADEPELILRELRASGSS